MADINALIRMRNTCLGLAGLSFLLWQAMQLAEDALLPAAPPAAGLALIGLGLIGILGFMGAMVMFLLYASRVSRTRSQSVIQDERFDFNQAKALRWGYMALLLAISLCFLAVDFIAIDAALMARGLMVVGVCVPIFAFLWLDIRDGEEEAE